MTTRSGFFFFDQAADLVHIILRCQKDVILRHFQPGSAQLDLPHRFLASDIQNAVLVGNSTAQLQKHSRFAHTRLTAQKHNAAQHNAAAKYTVQLRNAGQNTAFFFGHADLRKAFCGQGGHPFRAGGCRLFGCGRTCFGGFRYNVLVHRVPAAAAWAAAHPAGACLAAVGTHIYSFQFWFLHQKKLLLHCLGFIILYCSI